MRKHLKSKDVKNIKNMQDIEAIELEISNFEWELEHCTDGNGRRCIREMLSALYTRKDEIENEAKRKETQVSPECAPSKADESVKMADVNGVEDSEKAAVKQDETPIKDEKNNAHKMGVLSHFSTKAMKSQHSKKIEILRVQISELEWKLEHETDENERNTNLAKLQSKRKKLSKLLEEARLAGDEKLNYGLNNRIERIEKYIDDPYSEEQNEEED